MIYREDSVLFIPLQDVNSSVIEFERLGERISSTERNIFLTKVYIDKAGEYSLDKFKPLERYLPKDDRRVPGQPPGDPRQHSPPATHSRHNLIKKRKPSSLPI